MEPSSSKYEWYSYATKEWANAIILDDQYDTLNQNGKVHGATKQCSLEFEK